MGLAQHSDLGAPARGSQPDPGPSDEAPLLWHFTSARPHNIDLVHAVVNVSSDL